MIFVFPGQGSQKIGMGKDIYDNFSSARDIFHEVDDTISFGLSKLIFEGTEEELKKTENAQPALMTVSIAFFEVMRREFGFNFSGKAKFFAGHSLGEYTALCAAGSLSLRDTAKILRIRGKAMAEAYPTGGAMAAILGLSIDQIEEIVKKAGSDVEKAQIANDNSVGQVVISGHEEAVKRATEIAASFGVKRAVILPVSGPFHSELMQPAAEVLQEVLADVEFKSPLRPIIANITAKAETDNFEDLLLKQITGRVRWRESIGYAESHGVTKCIEIGAGRVLTGLIKRISPSMDLMNINTLESLEQIKEI